MNTTFDIGDFVHVATQQTITSNLVMRFKKRRKELGLSQKELSMRSGVSYGSIRRFEAQGDISLKSLMKISSAIACLEDFNALYSRTNIRNLKDVE